MPTRYYHSRAVVAAVRGLVCPAGLDREDLLQAGEVAVARCPEQHWHYRMSAARNAMIDLTRRNEYQRRGQVGDELPDQADPSQPEPVDTLQRRETVDAVRRAVLDLPRYERLVVQLRMLGNSFGYIGVICEASDEWARRTYHKAAAKLREVLLDYLD